MATSSSEAIIATAAPVGLSDRLPLKLFYGIGSIAYGVKDNGFQVLLLIFYNQALGLDARLAGLAIMIALVVDALVDPVVGYMSDRLRSRLGRRHPFMYGAAVPVSLSYHLLFSPPNGLSQGLLFLYLLTVAVFVRICISFYEIPSSALVAELASGYDERTSFLSYRYFFGWVAGLSMSILAFSVFLQADARHPDAYLNPRGYLHYGEAAAAIMFTAIIISSLGTQSAALKFEHQMRETVARKNMFGEIWNTVSTPSALAALVSGMLLLFATGLYFGLGTYFNIYAWQFSSRQISILTSSAFISAALSLPLAPWVARRFDKRGAALRVALVLIVLLPLPLIVSVAGLIPVNSPRVILSGLFVYGAIITTLLIIVPTLLASMLADVVEEIELRTGRRDEGVIFALNVFVQKCATGLGVFASTAILTFARFPSHAVPGSVPPAVISRLSLTYIVFVASLYTGSAICIWFYRITRAEHANNLRLLAERHAAQAAA